MKQLRHANAFLVQFRAAEVGAARVNGRIEHVASGLTVNFNSMEEVSELLLVMLTATDGAYRAMEQ